MATITTATLALNNAFDPAFPGEFQSGLELFQNYANVGLGALPDGAALVSRSATQVVMDDTNGMRLTFTGTFTASGLLKDSASFLLTGYSASTPTAVAAFNVTGLSVNQAGITGAFIYDDFLAGADTLTGSAADDKLYGGAGNDSLSGGAGADTMLGGFGNDTYVVDNLGDVIDEMMGDGTDTVQSSVSFGRDPATLFMTPPPQLGIENIVLTGAAAADAWGDGGNNIITGNSAANHLYGDMGNDLLDGGTGSDTLSGGMGDDTYVLDVATDVITGETGGTTDTVRAAFSYTAGSGIENVVLTGTAVSATGNASGNRLTGNNVANILDGGAGTDTMSGGFGDDTYYVDDAMDQIIETASGGKDTVITTSGMMMGPLGNNLENLTYLGTGDASLTGNVLNNVITGGSGNDWLASDTTMGPGSGIGGNDTLVGGLGNDSYIVTSSGDVVTELAGSGTDTVYARDSYTLSGNVEYLIADMTSPLIGLTLTGNDLANQIVGDAGNNLIDGKAGNDTLDGGMGGNDTYVLDSVGDVVATDMSGTDQILFSGAGAIDISTGFNGTGVENITLLGSATNATGNALDNVLIGNAGANVLSGGIGNDTLDGGAGADTMNGGMNSNTYYVDSTGDVIIEDMAATNSKVFSSITYSLDPASTSLRDLQLTGTAALNATGNGLDNTLTGNDGANRLDGGTDMMGDIMIGGNGSDTYVVDGMMDQVIETGLNSAVAGVDEVISSVSFSLMNPDRVGIEKVTLNGTSNLNAQGNDLANTLTGNAGNNVLDGLLGADTMSGGLGDDSYLVDNAGDSVSEAVDSGYDWISTTASYTLAANVEALELAASGITGTGNAGDNQIVADVAGTHRIDGAAGADLMVGNQGNDTFIVDNAGDVVWDDGAGDIDEVQSSVDFSLDGTGDAMMVKGVENLVLTGTAVTGTGSAVANRLIGNASANVLYGGEGDDTLDGGVGADTLFGGDGNDLYIVDNTGDVVSDVDEGVATGTPGNDRIEASVSYTLNGTTVQTLTLTGTGANNATGSAGNNWLYGNAGNNLIDGQLGADTMYGGAGNDTFIVTSSGDVVNENPGEGTDLVRSSVNFTLGANIENLELTGTEGAGGIGNAQSNSLTGNDGANFLNGDAGNDTMIGGKGDDTYYVDSAGDVVTESVTNTLGGGSDAVVSRISYTLGANLDQLRLEDGYATAVNAIGNAEANRIAGNQYNNLLDGMAGADSMSGGDGNDTYFVDSAGDQVGEAPGLGIDTVVFQASVGFLSGTVGSAIENIEIRNTGAAFTATGNTQANSFNARASSNTIMVGGDGDDTYYVDSVNDQVTEVGGSGGVTGTDLVISSATYALSASIESLTLTGSAAINGTGNAIDNLIYGNAGNNQLDGQGGADWMVGGLGNDSYFVDNMMDGVQETENGGTDTVTVSTTYALAGGATFIEALQVSSAPGLVATRIDLTGSLDKQTLTGHAGANQLDGGGGADLMIGLAGDDTYIVDNLGDRVVEAASGGTDTVRSTVSYTLSADVENLDLSLNITGNLRGTGNALGNSIIGNMMANVLDGRGGNDTMQGGMGDDVYIVDNAADVVDDSGGAFDMVIAQGDYVLTDISGVENIRVASGTSNNINITGNVGANQLRGNAGNNQLNGMDGNDTLDGGIGNDTLIGGDGDDHYVIDSTLDVITETGTGIDTVWTDVSISLASLANIENVNLNGASNLNVTGNALVNLINGNNGQNVIDGGAGADTINAGGQNDRIVFDALDTMVDGQGGFDTLSFASGSTAALDLTALNQFHGIEAIDMTSASANTLTLSASDILDVSNGPETEYHFEIWIKGDNTDTVNLAATGGDTSWSNTGLFAIDRGIVYRDFTADTSGADVVHAYIATNVMVP
jgi:Ca2+-binding RTX toxin-like protein